MTRFVRRGAVPFLCAVTWLVTACGGAAPVVESEAPRTEVRDSAGVRIVSAGFLRDSLASSEHLAVLDTLLDAATPAGEAVVGLVAVQPLADSSLVLFSESGPMLLRYPARPPRIPDTLTSSVSDSAAYGARPTLLPFQADTLLLWEPGAARLTRVTAAGPGSHVIVRYMPGRPITVAGAFADGSIVGVTTALPTEQGAGVTRAATALLRFTPDGAFRDTIVSLRGAERVVQLRRPGTMGDQRPVRSGSVPFGRTTLWTVGARGVLVLDTEGCNVARHDPDGALTQRLEFHCTIEAVTDEDREKFTAELLESARSRADSATRRRFVAEASFAPSKSTASGLMTDAWDRIWVRLPVRDAVEPWTWWVFEADGTPVARFGLARAWRIAAVRGQDLIAVETDRDDAPPVVVRMALPAALHRPP